MGEVGVSSVTRVTVSVSVTLSRNVIFLWTCVKVWL